MKHVVIVGAGISGLATAYQLRRLAREHVAELSIAVLEREARPGGRIWTEQVQGFQIERGANGFLDSKRSTLDLCCELGLGAELIAARPEARDRFLFHRDRLHKLPTGAGELVRSGLLSIRGKLRLLAEAFVAVRRECGDESVHEFSSRRIGREAAEVLVDAMVTGIHAGDPTLLSVAAAFPRMVQLEREYGSLLRAMPKVRKKRRDEAATCPSPRTPLSRGETRRGEGSAGPGGSLWSLKAGMGQLIETLAERCGAELIRGVVVKEIRPHDEGGWLVQAEGADRWRADAVVLACPSFTQAAITESLDPELSRMLAEIRYNSVVVVAVGFRQSDLHRRLDGFGYLSPQRSRRDVLGVLWSSSIFEHRAPDGMVLLQVMCGGWNRPEIVNWSDEQIGSAVLGEIRQTMQITACPVLVRIIRWPQAIPQYHLGHLDRVSAIETRRRRSPGLFLTGNSFRGISMNDCTEEAVRCAEEVVCDIACRV